MSATSDPQARLVEIQTLTDRALLGIGQLPRISRGSGSSPTSAASRAVTSTT